MRENGSKWILQGFFIQEAKKARGKVMAPDDLGLSNSKWER
jgi:hypothetical protein